MCTGECADGLAQRAAGQHTTVSEAEVAVERDDVEITRKTMVLEAVVEHEDFRTERGDRSQTYEASIATDQHGHSGRVRRQDQWLVSHPDDVTGQTMPVRERVNILTVAAAETTRREHDAVAPLTELRSQPGGEGGLSRASRDQAPDRDDPARQSAPSHPVAFVQRPVESSSQAVAGSHPIDGQPPAPPGSAPALPGVAPRSDHG